MKPMIDVDCCVGTDCGSEIHRPALLYLVRPVSVLISTCHKEELHL